MYLLEKVDLFFLLFLLFLQRAEDGFAAVRVLLNIHLVTCVLVLRFLGSHFLLCSSVILYFYTRILGKLFKSQVSEHKQIIEKSAEQLAVFQYFKAPIKIPIGSKYWQLT